MGDQSMQGLYCTGQHNTERRGHPCLERDYRAATGVGNIQSRIENFLDEA
jgi:hypothetical protein